jgi:hypothetical protein
MADLSPAAQAIVKAFDDRYELLGPLEDDWQEQCLAAAIRAASAHLGSCNASEELIRIAEELEGHA